MYISILPLCHRWLLVCRNINAPGPRELTELKTNNYGIRNIHFSNEY